MIGKDDNSLGALLHDTAHLLRITIDREVAPFNLTRAKWLALAALDRREGLTQTELANDLELGDATVGRLVERLEARGFIERRSDPVDARVKRLFIRDDARPELTKLEQVAANVRTSALKGITRSEQVLLLRLLNKIKQNLTALFYTVSLPWSRIPLDISIVGV